MKKTAVVTGATGQIGHELSKQLISEGFRVIAAVHPGSRRESVLGDCEAETVRLETRDISKIEALTDSCEFFFHLAWAGAAGASRQDTALQEQNVSDSLECLKAAARLGCKRFVFTGSQAEYGRVNGKITEETPLHPTLEYGRCKADFFNKAAKLCPQLGIELAHARIFSVYGYEDAEWTVVSEGLRRFIENRDFELSSCEQNWNFLYFKDAAAALLAMAKMPLASPAEIFNLASGDTRQLRSFIEEMRSITDTKGKALYGAHKSATPPVSLDPDISKLIKLSSWRPQYTFENGIKEMINHLKGAARQ